MEEVHVPFSRPPTVQICELLLTHQQVVWENKLTPSSKWHLTAQWAPFGKDLCHFQSMLIPTRSHHSVYSCYLLLPRPHYVSCSLDRCVFRLLEGWTRFDRFSYLRLNSCGAWNGWFCCAASWDVPCLHWNAMPKSSQMPSEFQGCKWIQHLHNVVMKKQSHLYATSLWFCFVIDSDLYTTTWYSGINWDK